LIFQFRERAKEKGEGEGEGWSARRGVGTHGERGEGSADSSLSNCFNFYVKS